MQKEIGLLLFLMLFNLHHCFAQLNHKNNSYQSDDSSKLENKILDTIMNLSEVKARAKYVRTKTNGKRKLQYTIWEKPAKQNPYYWVKVMEDNGTSYYTHFNFYVYPKSFAIQYYDVVNDTAITLLEWRKNYKE